MKQQPLMIFFDETEPATQQPGMVAWGGHRMSVHDLRGQDLASRLGAGRLWLESLFDLLEARRPGALVLMDPQMETFLGHPEENWQRLRAWLSRHGISLTVLRTRLSRHAA